MPEGPSIVMLRELAANFIGRTIVHANGNSDALLTQSVFSGVGNIIKNEVLFRIRVHPLSTIGALPPAKLRELVAQARQYSFDFLERKKAFVLKAHWLAHTKQICPRCDILFQKGHLGKTKRRSFFLRTLPEALYRCGGSHCA